ncbi:MAG: hypothetical protein JNK29_03390, partial [Anaerolineales bacterium]|nr:hypothetical protein [Anaerolineales bacterium]
MRYRLIVGLALVLLGTAAVVQREALGAWAFSVTGEEEPAAQVRALWNIAVGALRPPLDLRPETPILHNGVNPFGINTFLQQEVEPAKRARQVELIAAAGFHWLRQEFPWADLEISAKGNFEDCRNSAATGGCVSAWDKYDQIVGLAEQHGLEILARLSSPPAWSRADGDARGAFAPPDNVQDYADFAAAVAEHYRGRLRYFQIWNEPNIYPEWGDQPADPEAYARLLCAAYDRLKQVDPAIVVVSAPLAPTNPLGLINPGTNNAAELNDFVFLQRLYDAGAGRCFDVLAVQGYGLGSGPTDRRQRPLLFNYGRNLFIRDLMVKNGDAHKAIWIAEMNWNAAPENVPTIFGRVTEEQQARYAALAYQRAQAEWPWVGANMFWFFKRASDAEKDQAWYYFRMADPDFTLRPVYAALRDYISQARVMYPGWFQEDHWAVDWAGWRTTAGPRAGLGAQRAAEQAGATARFTFSGTDLFLVAARGPAGGQI